MLGRLVPRRISNTIGIDDAPFERAHRGDVPIVGAVFTRTRLDGAVTSTIRRDGRNSTTRIAEMIESSPFREHVQCVLLQGITLGGFNVVDIHALHERLQVPVLVVVRKKPHAAAIRHALLDRVPGGARKLALIEAAGPMESVNGVWVQRAGISLDRAHATIEELRLHGNLPEPLRVAHLLAGAYYDGVSRGRA